MTYDYRKPHPVYIESADLLKQAIALIEDQSAKPCHLYMSFVKKLEVVHQVEKCLAEMLRPEVFPEGRSASFNPSKGKSNA